MESWINKGRTSGFTTRHTVQTPTGSIEIYSSESGEDAAKLSDKVAAIPEMITELIRLFERYGHQRTKEIIKKAIGEFQDYR